MFKYGISHDPIDADGLSDRSRDQIKFLNLAVNCQCFYVKILIVNIPGREKARIIETQFIDAFCEKNEENP